VSDARRAGDRVVVMLTSPLEPEHVERIAGAFPDQIDVIFRPDLLPAPRYVADHGDPAWQRTPEQEREWHRLLTQAEILLDFPQNEARPLLELAPKVRWVQTTSAGVGPLVQRLGLQDSHLIVTTASGIHAQPLAEFVFAALLYHTKEIGRLKDEQRAHQWHRFAGVELAGRTMAIIGPGRIGREIARLARAFRMRVVAMGRDSDPARAGSLGVDRLTPQTADLLGATEFAALKPGAVFVNIGRGAIIDEQALLQGLGDGRIAFAALDVFREEPLPSDSPFWDMPNVLINPHSASTVVTENAKITELFVQNLGHYLAGEVDQMSPLLDKQRLY
jgi:phosphoglycerate dehydrogenase-like enzyme